jgi:hypothetical protein
MLLVRARCVGRLWGGGARSAAWLRRAAWPSAARDASKALRRCASQASWRSPQASSAGPTHAASKRAAFQGAPPACRVNQAQAVGACAADWQGEPLAWRVLGRMGAACHGRGADVAVRVRLHLRTPLPQSDGVPQAGFDRRSLVIIFTRASAAGTCSKCSFDVLPDVRSRFCFQRPVSILCIIICS